MISITVVDKSGVVYTSYTHDILVLDCFVWVYSKGALVDAVNHGSTSIALVYPQDVKSVSMEVTK